MGKTLGLKLRNGHHKVSEVSYSWDPTRPGNLALSALVQQGGSVTVPRGWRR